VLVVDSATLSDAEPATEEQTTKFGRRGGMVLRWAPKKAHRVPVTGLESTAREERFMATAQTRTKRSKVKREKKKKKNQEEREEKERAFKGD
jgi:hypothetical protein